MNPMIVLMLLCAAVILPASAQEVTRPEGWTDESHGNGAAPDYAVAFSQDRVNEITITIAPDVWAAMMENIATIAGPFNANAQPNVIRTLPTAPPESSARPTGDMLSRTPIWVAADIAFEGRVWKHAGIRFKGNSSLVGAWRSGVYKLGFKLDFDEFEDDYPAIHNQRFYGFKQLSLSNNWRDDSLLREKVAADVFRAAGIAAPMTAFYAVHIDYGDGPVYFGLYTAVEVVEDTMIETQFSGGGNVYKPEGRAGTFAPDTFDETLLSKENNRGADDFSDVRALHDALHDPVRLTDPDSWRANLEAVFDVDGFLRWQAANTVIQNWDTYGRQPHNFYLYNNPDTGLLTWIPWDNNAAFLDRPSPGLTSETDTGSISFAKTGVNESWPLIRYLFDQPDYYAAYARYVGEVSAGPFAPDAMEPIYTAFHGLVAPYAAAEQAGYSNLTSFAAFEASLAELIAHAHGRYAQAQAFAAAP